MRFDSYFIIAGVSLLIFIVKYWRDWVAIFLILIFYHGFFAYYGKGIENSYKVFIGLFAVYLFLYSKLNSIITSKDRKLIVAFTLFSISFFLSALVNSDPLILTLSQYFAKFSVVFIIFFLFKKFYYVYPQKFEKINALFILLIIVQILLSIYKYVNYNMIEGIVGTMSSAGGAIATTFPVYAFILIWLFRKGKLKRIDWILIVGVFFIGFTSNKRALWFIMPLMIFLVLVYIPQKKIIRKAAIVLPVLMVIFYVGVRLNPTLNPEYEIWGSFDFNFMMDYTTDYSLGPESYRDEDIAYGRVNSSFLLMKKFFSLKYNSDDLLGIGQEVTRSTNYEEFMAYDTGLGTKMAINGFYRTYITSGFIGVITILAWFWLVVKYMQHKKFKLVLLFFLIWDYFFYHGNSMDSTITMVMVMYIIWVSNYLMFDLRKSTAR